MAGAWELELEWEWKWVEGVEHPWMSPDLRSTGYRGTPKARYVNAGGGCGVHIWWWTWRLREFIRRLMHSGQATTMLVNLVPFQMRRSQRWIVTEINKVLL